MIEKSKVSIRDIAKIAGVSMKTVSRVLNNPELVKLETKQKVNKTINKLGFKPNLFARSLRTSRTKTIGLIIYTTQEEYLHNITTEIERVLRINNYKLMLGYTDFDLEIENEYLNTFLLSNVEGIIISSSRTSGKYLSDIMNTYKIPIILIENIFKDFNFNYVLPDNFKGMKILLEHLLELGEKKIAYISGAIDASKGGIQGIQRLEAYKKILTRNNINIDNDLIKIGQSWDFENGYQLTNELLKKNKEITSIITANYLLGLGALKSIKEHCLEMPNKLKLAAFDDFNMNELLSTPITTLKRIDKSIGVNAANLLLKKIKNRDIQNFENILIDMELSRRNST